MDDDRNDFRIIAASVILLILLLLGVMAGGAWIAKEYWSPTYIP